MSQVQRKQSRGEETKQRILVVTQQLLADHDFHSVTLDQISKQAGVSKSSLLWHFDSKEELLSEAACLLFQDLELALSQKKDNSLSLEEKLNLLLTNIGEYFDTNPEPKGVLIGLLFNSQIPQKVRTRIDEYWENHILALVDFLSYPNKPFPEAGARCILDLMHGSYMHWYLHKDKETFSQGLQKSMQYINISKFTTD